LESYTSPETPADASKNYARKDIHGAWVYSFRPEREPAGYGIADLRAR